MYGLLLESVRFHIKQSYGEKTWESLCRYCELTNSVFSSRELYNDNLMPKLAEACSALLPCGQPTSAYMEYFGKCFVEFTGNYGYSKVLKVYSRNFRDLLDSIDSLHEHLRFGFPKLQSPSFECKEESSNGLTLHYRSRRYGFKNYVIGQVKDLAMRYFNLNINVEILKEENLVKHGSKKYHVVYRIIFDNSSFMPVFHERKFLGHKRAVPIDLIFRISPFSFLIDKDLKIFRAAKDLNQYFGENMAGKYLQDVFIVRRPPTDLTWDELIYHERIIFELIAKQACNVSLFTNTDQVRITDILEEDTEFLKRIMARRNRSSRLQSKSKKGRSATVANGVVESPTYASKNKQQFFMSHEECMPINEDESSDVDCSLRVERKICAGNVDESADSGQDIITATACNESGSLACPVMNEPSLNTSIPCRASSVSNSNSPNCTNGNARCGRHVVSGQSDNLKKNRSEIDYSKYVEEVVYQNPNQNNAGNIKPAKESIEKEIVRETSALHSCHNGVAVTKCPHISSKIVEERDGFLTFDSASSEILKPLQPQKYTNDTDRGTIPNGNVRHSEEVMAEEQRAASKTITMLRTVKDKLLKSKIIRNFSASFQIAEKADSRTHVNEEINVSEKINEDNGLKDNTRSNDMVDGDRSLCNEKLKKSLVGEDIGLCQEKLSKSRTCSISRSSESLQKIESSESKKHFEEEAQTGFHSFPGVRKKLPSTIENDLQQHGKKHEYKPWRSKMKKWLERQQYKPLHLRGQMKHIKEWNMVLFIGTPLIGSVDDLRSSGLYLSDLGMHDGSGLLAMQGTQRLSEIEFAWDREKLKGKLLTDSTMELEDEKRKTEYLLYSMMPREIAERMKNGDRELTTCETFDNVTILFGYIHNFTEICNKVAAMNVVQLISELFSLFDILSENHRVYKFETIGGGVYMLVSGAPVKIDDHAREMALMAMHMLEEVQTLKNPLTDKPLELQIGIHSGPVVAGVIGQTTLQYCLFGNTVNISSRMQSTGKPMRIHLSTATNKELEASNMITKHRGQIPVKGVGNLDTYWLIGPKDQNQNNNNAPKHSTDLHVNNQVNN